MSDSATATAVQPETGRGWLLPLVLYCIGHFLVDGYQTALGTMQPVLQDRYHLSFTQAGILAGFYLCSGHMTQPLYGYLCDRFPSRLYSALGPAVIAVFLTCIGFATGFNGLLFMVVMSGIGAAAFHPQAASNAVAAITRNRSSAMAMFISCGTIGMAAGPVCFSPLLLWLGLDKLYISAIPGLAVTLMLVFLLPATRQSTRAHREFDWAPLRAVRKPMTILFLLVLIRSVVQVTFAQFLPLYLHSTRHYSVSEAGLSLSIYLFGGAIGGFAGGALSDRYGAKRIILISMIGSVPFLALFIFTQGILSTIGLWLGGLILLFTMPINVVIAQELVPSQAGTVSALMMGFAWGIAGFCFIPLVGWISDLWSMQVGFAVLTVFPILGFLVGLTLPRDIGARPSVQAG